MTRLCCLFEKLALPAVWHHPAPPNAPFAPRYRIDRLVSRCRQTYALQVHMSWPFLARPSDDPNAVGLLSLRLEITWFSTQEEGEGPGPAAADGRPEEEATSPSGGPGEGGRQGPEQWDEEKAVGFIQVSQVGDRNRIIHTRCMCTCIYCLERGKGGLGPMRHG